MKFSQTVVGTLQVGVIAAMLDGSASDVELDTLAAKVAKKYKTDQAAARDLAGKIVKGYSKKNVSQSPMLAVRYARKGLNLLSPRDAKVAFAIATDVIASEETDTNERGFLDELKELTL